LKGSRVQAVVNELGGERIDIVPWHPDPEVFARRALAPARVSKVLSDSARQVITAIVDEDQLSLAIGRNGQNVRLASQLIGWQIDLYGSREWLEKGADLSIFGDLPLGDAYETADFPLTELELGEGNLAALETAGYHTFLDIIDLEKGDFLAVSGLTEADADRLLEIIDELTVVEGEVPADETPGTDESEEPGDGDEASDAAEAVDGDQDEGEGDEDEGEGDEDAVEKLSEAPESGDDEPQEEPEEDGDEPKS
jgi:N utilization substance protein A